MLNTGQDLSTYVDKYTPLFSQLQRMGSSGAIPGAHKAPMILASIYSKCNLETTAAALRTKNVEDLTWEFVTTTLIDEYNSRQFMSSFSSEKNIPNRRNKKKKCCFSFRTVSPNYSNNDSDHSDMGGTFRALVFHQVFEYWFQKSKFPL